MKTIILRLAAGLMLPVIFTFVSCKQVVIDEKPGSHARISEILVVMDDIFWKSDLGDSVREHLTAFYPYLNQPQPHFSIVHRTPDEFSELYSIYRNIMYFNYEPELDGGTIQLETDYWAKPQVVIQINGRNSETMLELYRRNAEAIFKAFDKNEVRRLKNVMNSIDKANLSERIKERFNLKIAVPDGYYIAKNEDNFVWVRKVIRSQMQETAYWITTFEYTDTSQFNPENILALRDQVAKENIPVQDKESYMGTEYRFKYFSKVTEVSGNYAVETRGFWRTFGNHSMGGPYLNYLIHDPINDRLIMIDTYVFKPNEPKRDLVRQLEGIVHTLQIVSE